MVSLFRSVVGFWKVSQIFRDNGRDTSCIISDRLNIYTRERRICLCKCVLAVRVLSTTEELKVMLRF